MKQRVRIEGARRGHRPEGNGRERRRALEAILLGLRKVLQQPFATRGTSPDIMERARETQEDFVRNAMLDSCRDMLAQVDEALHRLASGKYGICAECGGSIPVARLRALPFAVRCLPCRERLEARAPANPGARSGRGEGQGWAVLWGRHARDKGWRRPQVSAHRY